MNEQQPLKIDYQGVELRSLFELAQVLNSSLNPDQILNSCLYTPMGRMMIGRGMMIVRDPEFRVSAVKGLPDSLLQQTVGIHKSYDHPVYTDELDEQDLELQKLFKTHQINLMVPMRRSDNFVGAICFGDKMTRQPYSSSELEFLDILSNIAATSIENALMYKELAKANRGLDKKNQMLNTLFEIGNELNSTLDTHRILNILLHTIMGEMAVHKVLIYLLQDGVFSVKLSKGYSESSKAWSHFNSKTVLDALSGITDPVMTFEPDSPPIWQDLSKHQIDLVVPMRTQNETRGVLALGKRVTQSRFSDDDINFLSSLGSRALISLENARMFKETVEKQRLEEEMAIARDIQNRLLPREFPCYPDFDVYGFNLPSLMVGGDYFDCLELNERFFALAIGDVSGKGVGASLLMSNLHAALHALAPSQNNVAELIERLNNLIYAHTNFDKFITFFYALIDRQEKILTYVNAGHNFPYLYHKDGSFDTLETGGLILGMMQNALYESVTLTLQPHDMLIMFTDGITEAKAASDEFFEEERLEAFVDDMYKQGCSVRELADQMIARIQQFSQGYPQSDDITFLGLKLTGQTGDYETHRIIKARSES
ncbi:MAG: GAF domain-containing SpoIIE family protein phosphatase [candidate division KSB1 bacterium]|nr:GAF domain-containing SpoIIE family protein phosphatase [candidate division KSB1 bacterium]